MIEGWLQRRLFGLLGTNTFLNVRIGELADKPLLFGNILPYGAVAILSLCCFMHCLNSSMVLSGLITFESI